MVAKKSRHKKFRGRTYLDDLITYLSASEWDMVLDAINKNATDEAAAASTRIRLTDTEVHRVDVDSNSAGHASWKWNRIDLHTHILSDDAPAEEPGDTLFHEIAHLIAGWACDDRNHGRKWQQVFADLGYPNGKRCHSMPRLRGTTGKPRTRTVYVYQCNGCDYSMERRRKFSDPARWHHRSCKDSRSRYIYVSEYKETL